MVTTVNALDLIDSELTKAAQPRPANKRPVFLYLKEGHKALIRPLVDLSKCIVLSKHSKYSPDAESRVNAICASETEEPCQYCQQASNDKKLTANIHFYLPVYVYRVVDATGATVTYKDSETQEDKPVQGVRVLEMARFGTVADILKFFRAFMQDEDNCSMTECDFALSQSGSGQQKSFVIMPKAPKPMAEQIKAIIPTSDRLRERILEALPPVVAGGPSKSDAAVAGVVQAVKNTQVSNDDIPEF